MEANLKQIFIKLNAIKVINVLHLAPYLFFTLDEVVFIHVKLQLYKNYGYIYILKENELHRNILQNNNSVAMYVLEQ